MTEQEKLAINRNHDSYIAELTEKKLIEKQSFNKQILIICTTLLGILISLKTGKITDKCEFISFILVIGTLGLCILIGVILLYENVHTLNIALKSTQKRRIKLLAGKKEDSTLVSVYIGKFFYIAKIFYYASFALSILSLVVYALFSF